MPNDEPLTVSIRRATEITGESRSKIYEHIALGRYAAVKSDGKTLVLYASIKKRIEGLPAAVIKPKRPA